MACTGRLYGLASQSWNSTEDQITALGLACGWFIL